MEDHTEMTESTTEAHPETECQDDEEESWPQRTADADDIEEDGYGYGV